MYASMLSILSILKNLRIRIFRVKESDVSLCVLSLPDVVTNTADGPRIRIPPSLESLITPETFFLLNKSDLSKTTPPAQINGKGIWTASLNTGEGTQEFINSFAIALQAR